MVAGKIVVPILELYLLLIGRRAMRKLVFYLPQNVGFQTKQIKSNQCFKRIFPNAFSGTCKIFDKGWSSWATVSYSEAVKKYRQCRYGIKLLCI